MSSSSQGNSSATWIKVCVLTFVVLYSAFAVRASGDEKKASAFATVDFKQIAAEFKQKDLVEQNIKAMQAKYDARLSRRDNMPLLAEDEQKRLDELTEKPTQTDKDKAEIAALEAKAKKLNDEIQALQVKKDTELSEAEKAKLKDAGQKFQEAQKRFAQIKEDLSSELNKYGSSQSDDLMKKIRDAVKKVAEQKQISLVFNSDVALYAGNDITKNVVDELNKR